MIKRIWNLARQTDLARHGVPLFLALTLANLSNYFFHVIISRLLTPQDYGALGGLLSLFVLISVPAGAVQTIVAKKLSIFRAAGDLDSSRRLMRSMLRGAVAFGLAGSAVVAALAGPIREFLHLDGIAPSLLLAAYIVFAVVSPVVRGGLQGRLQFRPLGALAAGSTMLRLVAGVVLVQMGFGVAGAVAASVIAEIAGLGFGLIPLSDLLKRGTKGPASTGMLKEAQLAILAFGGFWGVVSLDSMFARHFFPSEASGFYSAAAVAAHMILFLPSAIAMVAFPRFAESEGRSVDARRTLFHAIVAVTIFGFSGAAFLSLFNELVIKVMFGVKYSGGSATLPLLSLAMGFLGIVNVLTYFHLAAGSKALWSLVPAMALEGLGIALFHGSIVQVAVVVLVVGFALLLFLLIAAYAHPGDVKVQPRRIGELWQLDEAEIDLTVVTPAFNPGPAFKTNLESIFEVLREANLTYEVIAVSDGTTDGSHLAANEFPDGTLRLIHYDVNRGKGFALRTGLAQARGRYVAFIDSDGDLHPSELRSFVTLMKTYEVDLVIGSKRHPLSDVHYPLLRRVMSWSYHFFVRVLFGIKLSDTQTGLKLARREVLAEVLPRMLEKRFAFDLEMLVIAKLLGFNRFLEAPVRLDYKFASTVSLRTTIATAIDTLAIFYRRYILRYYDQPMHAEHSLEASETAIPVEVAEVH